MFPPPKKSNQQVPVDFCEIAECDRVQTQPDFLFRSSDASFGGTSYFFLEAREVFDVEDEPFCFCFCCLSL